MNQKEFSRRSFMNSSKSNDHDVVFILEPHMDDGLLGCAGLVLSNKHDIYYLITVSTHLNNEERLSETKEVINYLKSAGVNITHIQLGGEYLDGVLDNYPYADILSKLENLSYKYNPTKLYIPYPSSHQDHRLVYELGISLSRVDYKHFIPNVYIYEPYLSSWSPIPINYGKKYIKLSETQSKEKLKVIGLYKSQIDDKSHKLYSINSINDFMKLRGRECNCDYAEAFYVMREVI